METLISDAMPKFDFLASYEPFSFKFQPAMLQNIIFAIDKTLGIGEVLINMVLFMSLFSFFFIKSVTYWLVSL